MTNTGRPSTSSSGGRQQASFGAPSGNARVSASPAPPLQHQNSYGSQTSHATPAPPTPHFTPQPSYGASYPTAPPPVPTPNPLAGGSTYSAPTSQSIPPRDYAPPPPSTSSRPFTTAQPYTANAYNPPKHPAEVYHLTDKDNSQIPYDVRRQFHCDEFGRVLFFTSPPLDVDRVSTERKKDLSHSLAYRAKKLRQAREKRAAEATASSEATNPTTAEEANGLKRRRSSAEASPGGVHELQLLAENIASNIQKGTENFYKNTYGPEWQEIQKQDQARLAKAQDEARRSNEKLERSRMERELRGRGKALPQGL